MKLYAAVKSAFSFASLGVILASSTLGAVLTIVTIPEFWVEPESSPSLGVTEKDHSSPLLVDDAGTVDKLSKDNWGEPSLFHEIVEPLSLSPSQSK